MEPNYKTLPLDFQPQQSEFVFNDIKFSSKFDSGNLMNVTKVDDCTFNLFTSQDCFGTTQEYSYRTWFYFGVFGAKEKRLTLNICNMNNQMRMFEDGYKIVYRRLSECKYGEDSYDPNEEFYLRRLESEIKTMLLGQDKKTMQVTFSFDFNYEDDKGVLFSFCFPWSYNKNQHFLKYIDDYYKSKDVYYNREVLTYSKEKRRVDLITISSFDNITNIRENSLKNLFPINSKLTRSYSFSKEKPLVFISARVHPGETPSSYLMNGIIKFLLDKTDPRAKLLRKFFVFKLIPIINVDGVSRGYYRYDTNSLNMNRHYPNPNIKIQPEIYAIRRLFMFYSQEYKVRYYYDLHGHVQSKGLFLFGNSLDFLLQVENCLLPKLIELNCEYLCFDNCLFDERCMKSKERGDKNTKEGTGRVHFYKCTDIIHSYTIEASYFRGIIKNTLSPCNTAEDKLNATLNQILSIGKKDFNFQSSLDFYETRPEYNDNSPLYSPVSYEKMGVSLLISILDYEELNPYSRILNSDFKELSTIRRLISTKLVKEDDKYKTNVINHNLNKDINSVKKFFPLFEKYSNFISNSNKKAEGRILGNTKAKGTAKELKSRNKPNIAIVDTNISLEIGNNETKKANYKSSTSIFYPKIISLRKTASVDPMTIMNDIKYNEMEEMKISKVRIPPLLTTQKDNSYESDKMESEKKKTNTTTQMPMPNSRKTESIVAQNKMIFNNLKKIKGNILEKSKIVDYKIKEIYFKDPVRLFPRLKK